MPPRAAYTIRLGTMADIPAITAMYQQDGFFAAQGDPTRAAFYFTAVRAAGGEVLLAVDDTDVVGHLEFLLCSEALPLGQYGYIATLEVRADRRRQGLGRALVEQAIQLTCAAGGTRVEVWTGDDNAAAQALYASAGFTAGVRMRDLELAVTPDTAREAAPLGPRLASGARPWVDLRHVAGRLYPAAYCWWQAQLASGWGLPNAAETGAWHLRDSATVVLASPWSVHLFLPPEMAPDSAVAWPAWLAMFGLRATGPQRWVRTVVTVDLAERLQLVQRWPGRVIEDFTLLDHELR
jgi:ribosomal protein S18 acetylase RimI-like enzyme